MDFKDIRKAHCIGIKGAGMTALAEVLVKKGIRVTGSDTSETFFTDEVLKKSGIGVAEGFSVENIPSDADLIVYSTAYAPETNVELKAALAGKVRTLSYPEVLGELMKDRMGIAVCGTHGKTTTSALLAEVLRAAGEDPLAIIGSRISQWGGNSLSGDGKYFVLEADEYQNKLRHYTPFGAILTSVDWDHPDFFPDFDAYKKVFIDMVGKMPHHGVLVSWGDSASVAEVAKESHAQRLSYGFLEDNDFRITQYAPVMGLSDNAGQLDAGIRQTFEVSYQEESLGTFALRLAGKHNALNATAVIALCTYLKIDVESIREGLRNFEGTARRFEYVGTYRDAILYDDYAHHPEEIKATLKAFRDLYPDNRLVAVFHPHTFTRTKALLNDFAQSFDDADKVYILDIYGSAREAAVTVSSRELVDLVNRYDRGKADHLATIDDAIEELRAKATSGDVVVTLGAGNVWEVAHALKNAEN